MPKLAKNEIENLTAEDMRDYMYGSIKEMIQSNTPENVAFHYFMPPIPFGRELGAFMEIGPRAKEFQDQGFTEADLMRSAVNFATIVDYVPAIREGGNAVSDINALISSGVKVSNVYESILNNIRVFNNERSDEDKEKLRQLRALLYEIPEEEDDDVSADVETVTTETVSGGGEMDDDDLLSGFGDEDGGDDFDLGSFEDGAALDDLVVDPDAISPPTRAMKLYDALMWRYNNVQLKVADEMKKISPNDPNAPLRREVLARQLRHARRQWEAQGNKTKVENIIARIEQLSQGGMVQYLSDLRDRFRSNKFTASVFSSEEFGQGFLAEEAYYTALRPNGLLSGPAFLKVHLSNSNTESWSKFESKETSGGFKVPFSFGSASASASHLSQDRERRFFKEDFEISFEIAQGLIDRPWFAKDFIECRAYTTVDPETNEALDPVQQITMLSDGEIPPKEGLVPAIPMTAYFVRNLTVRSSALASLSSSEIERIKAKGGVSIFGFGAKAAHENTTVETNYSRAGTMGEITADGTYLVALSSIYLKKAPNPDFDTFPRGKWI